MDTIKNTNVVTGNFKQNDSVELDNRKKDLTVEELVKKYEGYKTTSAKEAYLNQAVKFVDYIDFEIVQVICDSILVNSCMDSQGNVRVDSCKKYLMYVFMIFDQYTNIQVNPKEWAKEFNMLYKNGLVDEVCKLMPEMLITTLDSVLKMKTDDMMTNYYEPHAFIRNQVIKYIPMVHKFIDKMIGEIEKIDINKIYEIIKEDNKNE